MMQPRQVIIEAVRQKRLSLVGMLVALLFMFVSQGLLLFLIKPFLEILFTNQSVIELREMFPGAIRDMVPRMSLPIGEMVFWVPFAIAACGSVRALSVYVYQVSLAKLALTVARRYREALFAGLVRRPYLKVSSHSPADLMSVIMNDVLHLQMRFSELLTSIFRDAVLLIACLGFLCVVYWPAALACVLAGPFFATALGRMGRRIGDFARQWQLALADMAALILDIRERFPSIRAQGGEALEAQRFRVLNDRYLKNIVRSLLVRSALAPAMELIGFAALAGLMYVSINHGAFTGDLLIQIFAAFGLALRPLKNIGEQVSKYHETMGALRRSTDFLRDVHAEGPTSRTRTAGSDMSFDNLTINRAEVRYGESPAVGASEVEMRPGRMCAVVGQSGAGKSTLIKCMAGLISPHRWDATLAWEHLANNTAYVSQNSFLFSGSVRENLTYGLARRVEDAELSQILRDVNLSDIPLDAETESIRASFSGGQVQRLMVARALVQDKKILLLDEATSSLDLDNERLILRTVRDLTTKRKLITLAITHRVQALDYFDEVLFIENGELSLRGEHETLLEHQRYSTFIDGVSASV